MKKILLAAILANLIFSVAPANPAAENTLQGIYRHAHAVNLYSQNVQQRIAAYSKYFYIQKAPYLASPLGEGPQGRFSQAPLYRFDGFDCTTLVETVMALALSETPAEFKITMNQIRYKDGRIGYATRNHFPSIDWIPNNEKSGFIRDITADLGGLLTKTSETLIEKDEWYKKKGPEYIEISRQEGKTLARINYISKEDLLSHPDLVNRIPSGAVFNVVRPNWNLKAAAGTNMDVSHQGFLIREKGVLYMIHASNGAARDGSDEQMRVKKDVLVKYVEDVMMNSPSTGGINILQVRSP